jgi:predicted DNA-binding transcriptional regulator AlpA
MLTHSNSFGMEIALNSPKGKEKIMDKINVSQDELVFGIIEAAKYLNITKKTVHVLINESVFPNPIILQNVGKRVIKVWKKSDLDSFKPNLRPAHRPKSVT